MTPLLNHILHDPHASDWISQVRTLWMKSCGSPGRGSFDIGSPLDTWHDLALGDFEPLFLTFFDHSERRIAVMRRTVWGPGACSRGILNI